MEGIHPHILTCNAMAQFKPDGAWMPLNICGDPAKYLAPNGREISGAPIAVKQMSPQEIHADMRANGWIYVGNYACLD